MLDHGGRAPTETTTGPATTGPATIEPASIEPARSGPDPDDRPETGRALRAAQEQGRICALAAAGQRDLLRVAEAYPELFPSGPFDPALFGTVSLATAFGAPWCDGEQLRIANRTALWIFAVDWLVDHRAASRGEVDSIVDRCSRVADGTPPVEGDPLTAFLAEIRDELRDCAPTAFASHRSAWQEEFRRMLRAMATEWDWKKQRERAVGGGPDLEAYLANADNFGSSFVNVSHWIRTADPDTLRQLPELTAAGREVQRVLRLVNDLATYQRDLRWGDLNVLMLGVPRTVVTRRVDQLVERCHQRFAALPQPCRKQGDYLARQIGFSTGFYRLTDHWGPS